MSLRSVAEAPPLAEMLHLGRGVVPQRTGIEERLHRADTLRALDQLKNIPALQSLARGFVQATGNAATPVSEIVEWVKKDSSLCVRILGMANSAGVGAERRVEDLHGAVQMLGVLRIRRLAHAIFTLRDAQRMAEGVDWRHLWVHALATAALAEELERRLRPRGESQIYLAGLLHDVGKVVLSTIAPEIYRGILIDAWNGAGELEALERERLGVDHREAGTIFARHHKLPALAIEAISHHAWPEDAVAHRLETALVALANHLSKAHGLGFSGARLAADEPEFHELRTWKVVEAECGHAVDPFTIEMDLADFIAELRAELRELHRG